MPAPSRALDTVRPWTGFGTVRDVTAKHASGRCKYTTVWLRSGELFGDSMEQQASRNLLDHPIHARTR
jgi:hypothetical protein